MALVKQRVAELLAHRPQCRCGRCEAAAVARVGHVLARGDGVGAVNRRHQAPGGSLGIDSA